MAAVVNHKKLSHFELKAQTQELEVVITSGRASLLRKGHKALTAEEERYLKRFAEMQVRGLAAVCTPPPTRQIAEPAPLRRQQQQPGLMTNRAPVVVAPHLRSVPSMNGSH